MTILILAVIAALLCIASGIWVAVALVNAVRGDGGLSVDDRPAEGEGGDQAT